MVYDKLVWACAYSLAGPTLWMEVTKNCNILSLAVFWLHSKQTGYHWGKIDVSVLSLDPNFFKFVDLPRKLNEFLKFFVNKSSAHPMIAGWSFMYVRDTPVPIDNASWMWVCGPAYTRADHDWFDQVTGQALWDLSHHAYPIMGIIQFNTWNSNDR